MECTVHINSIYKSNYKTGNYFIKIPNFHITVLYYLFGFTSFIIIIKKCLSNIFLQISFVFISMTCKNIFKHIL